MSTISCMFGHFEGLPKPESSLDHEGLLTASKGSSVSTITPLGLEPLVAACRMVADGTSRMVSLPIAHVQFATDE